MLVGWVCFSPVASRVSARQPSYFFLRRQKKVTKKKASHVRAASRSLALLAAFGTLANSLRSNSASVLIRTLLRCSARPNGGFEYLTARPLRGPRPGCSFAALTSRGLGLPHFSTLTSLKARHAVPLRPSSLLTPTTSLLRPHSYALTPTTSLLPPHSSLLTPTTSPLPPHSYDLTPPASPRAPAKSAIPRPLRTRQSGLCPAVTAHPASARRPASRPECPGQFANTYRASG